MIVNAKPSGILSLGRTGENQARSIRFDISHWVMDFGQGVVELVHQRSGDPYPYPVVVSQDGNEVTWNITATDTAAAGTGRAELQYYVGDTLAKSETWMTKVLSALGPASETPPEAQQGWVDQVLAQVARITGMTAQAVELPAGSAPTADYTDGVLTIGIPLGGDVSEAQIAQAVAEYLSRNPIDETDPTVPDWAKEEKKPSYTAAEVGADPSGTAASQVSAHNTGTDTHSDIRLLIQGLTERLNTLADSDDTTLDQLSEIVAYIKSNRTLIEAITTSKVSVADIIDNLTTNVTNKPLSAAQGVALKALIDAISIPDKLPNPNALTFTGAVTGRYDGSEAVSVEIPSGGGGLTVTNTAAVGQTVRITAVDENGQPTEWEAVDMQSGGGGTTSDEWIDLGTLTLADGEEAINFSWKVNGQVKKIHIEGAYYSATSGKNLSILNTDGLSAGSALITYSIFKFPSSTDKAMYMDLTVEELYPGYWFGVGGASVYNNPHENTIASYGSPKRVDSYLSLGEYWRNTPLTAGTWFNVKVVYY